MYEAGEKTKVSRSILNMFPYFSQMEDTADQKVPMGGVKPGRRSLMSRFSRLFSCV